MHIPDGMLSTQVAAASAATSTGVVAYAVNWTKRNLSDRHTVLMAVMAALVFALQMLNFPIAPGISGHFAGGAAAALLLGPWPAVIVLTTVLLVQAFMFADGGVVALGANVLNLAIIGPFVGYAVATGLRRLKLLPDSVRIFTAAWAAVVVSALAVAIEVWLSGRAPLGPALAALGGWHAIVGIGEGLITVGLIAFVTRVRPDVLPGAAEEARGTRAVALVLGALALVAGGLSWLASSHPDALESVAATSGFSSGLDPLASPLAEYAVPGVANDALAGVLAGVVGLLLAGSLLWGLGLLLRKRRADAHANELHRHRHEHESEPEHAHPHHHRSGTHEHAHPLVFERYTYTVSPIHALDPRAKIVAALIVVLGVVLAPPPQALEFVLMASLLLGVTLLARVPVRAVLARSTLVLPVAITLALFAPLTAIGWPLAWAIVSKSWLSALTVILLSATTPPAKLLLGLRRLHLPQVFITTLSFLYRFAVVLGEQLTSMRRAVASRGPTLPPARRVALYGNLAGNLFVRSYERGERVHSAMLARGFAGSLPSAEVLTLRPADAALVVAALLTAAALLLY